MASDTPTPRITALNLYPVKSCRGIALSEAGLTAAGLSAAGVGDREWMIVDSAGEFLTQRDSPELAQIAVSVRDGVLELCAPGLAPLVVRTGASPIVPVTIWDTRVRGIDAGDAPARWLTRFLARDARLVRFDSDLPRPCDPKYAGNSDARTLFSDGFPVLVIGQSSLADLNARLAAKGSGPLPMNRFRPNIVIDGLEPYDEDHLDLIEAPNAALRLVKPCTRCAITVTDQETATRGLEPLETLAGYRLDQALGGVTFGMNAIVTQAGMLRVGESVGVTFRF